MIVVTDEQDKLIDKNFEPGDNEACCHVTVRTSNLVICRFGPAHHLSHLGPAHLVPSIEPVPFGPCISAHPDWARPVWAHPVWAHGC